MTNIFPKLTVFIPKSQTNWQRFSHNPTQIGIEYQQMINKCHSDNNNHHINGHNNNNTTNNSLDLITHRNVRKRGLQDMSGELINGHVSKSQKVNTSSQASSLSQMSSFVDNEEISYLQS